MYLRKLFELGKLEYKTSMMYRFNFLSTIVISPLMMVLVYFLWLSVYSNTGSSILGYSFNDMMSYFVITLVISHFIYNMVGNKLETKIRYGNLIQDLLKPVSIFSQFLSREFAERGFAFLVEVIPVFLIGAIFFKIKIQGILITFIFILGLIMAFMINFLLGYLTGIMAFWIKNTGSLQWLMFFIIRFFSGEFLPLDFFGESFLKISKFLPFYYLRYGLSQVYLGNLTIMESLIFLVSQLAWVFILYLVVMLLWSVAIKKFGAEGG